jgi:hypothetical protein
MAYTIEELTQNMKDDNVSSLTPSLLMEAFILIGAHSDEASNVFERLKEGNAEVAETRRAEIVAKTTAFAKELFLNADKKDSAGIAEVVVGVLVGGGHNREALDFAKYCIDQADFDRAEIAKGCLEGFLCADKPVREEVEEFTSRCIDGANGDWGLLRLADGFLDVFSEQVAEHMSGEFARKVVEAAEDKIEAARTCIGALFRNGIDTTKFSKDIFGNYKGDKRVELARVCTYQSLDSYSPENNTLVEGLAVWFVRQSPTEAEQIPMIVALYTAFLDAGHEEVAERFRKRCTALVPLGIRSAEMSDALGKVQSNRPKTRLDRLLNNFAGTLGLPPQAPQAEAAPSQAV